MPTPHTEDRTDRWQTIRSHGRRRYILRRGVIGWGVTTGLLWALGMSLLFPDRPAALYFLLGLTLFPLGGVLWGSAMWNWSERAWQRRQQG